MPHCIASPSETKPATVGAQPQRGRAKPHTLKRRHAPAVGWSPWLAADPLHGAGRNRVRSIAIKLHSEPTIRYDHGEVLTAKTLDDSGKHSVIFQGAIVLFPRQKTHKTG